MKIRDLQILTALLVAISFVLLSFAVAVWLEPVPDMSQRQVQAWQPADNFAILPSQVRTLKTELAQALERPLFRVSRRPFDPSKVVIAEAILPPAIPAAPQPSPPAAPTAPQLVQDSSQLSLKGIAIDSINRLALIATSELPDGEWLAVGAELNGWKVKKLDPNSVTLAAGDQTVILQLYVDNKSNSVGNPPPTP
jgi:hypothetical protein